MMPTGKLYPVPVYKQNHGFIKAEDGATAGATIGVDLVFEDDGIAGVRELGVSTGLLQGGKITINLSNNARFDVAAGKGLLVDYVSDPPMVTSFDFGPFLNQVVTNIGSQPVTYIGVTLDGLGQPVLVQSSTEFTNTQRRSIVSLGLVVHSNNINLNAVNTIAAVVEADANQLHDFMEAIGPLNIEGNEYGPDGANLFLDKSAGKIFKFGVAHDTTPLDPHVLAQGSGNQLTFRYRLRDSTEFADRTTIDPANFDNGGVLTAVQANRYTVQRITMFQSGLTRIQYGQAEYQTLADAVAGFEKEVFVTEPNIKENGILRCYLVVKQSATALNDPAQAQFFPVSKFGSATGGGGAGITAADIITALGYVPANAARDLIAGAGLIGGGNLAADRTVEMGTPSSVSSVSTNSTTADSHTHALVINDASLTIAKTSGLQAALDGKLGVGAKAADSELLDGINSTSFVLKAAPDYGIWRRLFRYNAADATNVDNAFNEHGFNYATGGLANFGPFISFGQLDTSNAYQMQITGGYLDGRGYWRVRNGDSATWHTMREFADLNTAQTFVGQKSFTQEIKSTGASGGYSFDNRSGAGRWVLFSNTGQADLFFEGVGIAHSVSSVGDTYKKNANSTALTRQPRTFVQAGDPGAAAADGDLWFF